MKWIGKTFAYLREKASTRGFACDVCGAEIFSYPKPRICQTCQDVLRRNDRHVCPKCGRQGVAEGVCLTCKRMPPIFKQGVSPFVYTGDTASQINRIKNGYRRLAYFLGEEMAKTFLARIDGIKEQFDRGRVEMNKENPTQTLLVLPVPLTRKKERLRGYNQSQELCEVVVKTLQEQGVAVELGYDVLQKKKETPMQKHLHVQERFENAFGAYHVHKRTVCRDRTVLLVDDIMTTGATGHECARVLYNAGAKDVYFLTAASLQEQK